MKSPEEYRLLINERKKSFNNLLNEIVNSYPLFKINKNIDTYRNTYKKDVENLEKIKSNIFLTSNDLQNDSKLLTNFIKEKNKIIEKLNKENKKLTKELNTLENQDNAADGEFENRIKNYYIKLTENLILLGLSISLIIFYGYHKTKK